MVIAKGEPETGKSTAIRAASSLFGWENIGYFVKLASFHKHAMLILSTMQFPRYV